MKKRRYTYLLFTSILLAACGSQEHHPENLPIVVTHLESQAVDIDTVIMNAEKEVKKVLPNANLTFFSLVGECKALGDLKGEVHLFFSETRRSLFGHQVFTAWVVVDTAQQTLSMEVQDETKQYLSTEPLELTGVNLLQIAETLENYLVSTERCNDTVVLARSTTAGPWRARCGPPDAVFLECLEIDPETGQVTELQ